jgi:hypothetical protein
MKIQSLVFILLVNLLHSCTTNMIVLEKIKVIDVYSDNEQNVQLGKDLLFYDYVGGLTKLLPDMTESDLDDITWERFIRENDNQVSFRIKLNIKNDFISKNQNNIKNYFIKEVSGHIDRYVKNEKLLDSSISVASQYFQLLDNKKYHNFLEQYSYLLKTQTTEEEQISGFKFKEAEFGEIENRLLNYKLISNQVVEGKNIVMYFIAFKSKYTNRTIQEIITLGKDNRSDEWKIFGYGTRHCDMSCQI